MSRDFKITKALKFKKLSPNAVTPTYAHNGDACFDLTATSVNYDTKDMYVEYGTGLAFNIPEGYVGLIFARSSVTNQNLMLKNAIGIIDSGFFGEVKFRFQMTPAPSHLSKVYEVGNKVGQMMLVPVETWNLHEVKEFEITSERGTGAYGSSGV